MTWLTNVPMNHPVFAEQRWYDAAWQHQAVMSLYGHLEGDDARAAGGILFRTEPDRTAHDGSGGRLLVQSAVRPADSQVRVTDLDVLLDRLTTGTPVQLLLRANTVRTINRTGADGRIRRHRARVPDGDLEGWLKERLDGALDLDQLPRTTPGGLRRGRAHLITTTYNASGTVTDDEALVRLVRDGVGRAKAYGCGMLLVLPIS